MTSTIKTSKFSKKLLAAIIIIIIIVASASAAAVYYVSQKSQSSSTTLPSMSLTLTGADGQQKTLNQIDLAALESYSAKGGFKTSGGLITGVGTYTGVPVTDLLNSVGGITSDQTLNVTASDGYVMTFTYNQVNGQDFTTYDPVTGSQATPTHPMELVLTYYLNGTILPSDEGPLRLGVLGSEGLLTDGHYWVKMVTALQVIPNVTPTLSPTASPTPTTSSSSTASPSPSPTATPWGITMNGTAAVTMSQSTFATLVSQNTATYTDSSTSWSGTPLYQLVAWAQNNGVISSSALTAGFVVKVIGSDGNVATFNETRINNNANIMVANIANGTALTGNYYPLTLTGSDLANTEKVKEITQIQILPIQDCSVTIVSSNGTRITLFSNDLAKMSAITFNGGTLKNGAIINYGNYTGVKVLDLCNLVGITSSNTVKVIGSDAYAVSYTYSQVASGTGFSTYDSSGNTATPTNPLYLILAYWCNGTNLATGSSGAGPLKTMVVGADNLNTPGNIAAKWVVEIDII